MGQLRYLVYTAMENRFFSLFVLFALVAGNNCQSQDDSILWHPPLDIPIYLAGNFGELRNNHFHTGLDMKTEGREGLPIRSTEEGYVSRIKVSPYGYGYALYVQHPNGYTTVYGHMKVYNEEITQFTKDAQYDLERFGVDLFPGPGQLPVEKGEVLGLSGNSGSSGGPHLHFEIRETDTESPVNPLLFNLEIKDDVPPQINEVMIIPLNDSSWVNGARDSHRASVLGGSGKYSLSANAVSAIGKIGLAVDVIDKLNGFPNKCGIYTIKLFANGELIYEQTMDKLCFDTNRYMNAHTVYPVNKAERKNFQRNYLLSNNGLDIYGVIRNRGKLNIRAGAQMDMRYEITDVAGNLSVLDFKLTGKAPGAIISAPKEQKGELMKYDTVNAFRSERCTVYLPEGRLYEDLYFEHKESKGPQDALSMVHKIGDRGVPVHNEFILKIRTVDIPASKQGFALVATYNSKNGKLRAKGGKYKMGWMETRVKSFGSYCVVYDSIPPVIRNSTLRDSMKGKDSFSVTITDNLSGINEYRAEVNGQFILGAYDPKRARVTFELESARIHPSKKYEVVVSVKDERGNEALYESSFTW
ncbi:MAG: hypothetical protein ACI943_002131 [Gammaproteobacteria bacterium]|jgi:hypothetical protein